MKIKRIVVVLGMHRCGTSAITRGLQVLGVDLGDKLIGAVPGNHDKGFWEDLDIQTTNDDILAKLKSSWSDVGTFEIERLTGDEFSQERVKARTMLEKKLAESSIFGFKDPRISLLLPFWKDVFAGLNISVSYVICLRNPLSVAQDLKGRDQLPEMISFVIWFKYFIHAIEQTRDEVRIIVDFPTFLENPSDQLLRIAQRLELPFPNPNLFDLEEFTASFLDNSFHHHTVADSQLNGKSNVPKTISIAYKILKKSAHDELDVSCNDFKDVWKPVRLDYKKIVYLIDFVKNYYGQHLMLQEEVTRLREKIEVNEMEKNVHRYELQLKKDEIATLTERIDTLQFQLERMELSKSWKITKPLRGLRGGVTQTTRYYVSSLFRVLWRRLPLALDKKIRLKQTIFQKLPLFFKRTQAYRDWTALVDGGGYWRESGDEGVCTRPHVKVDTLSTYAVVNDNGKKWYIDRKQTEKVPKLDGLDTAQPNVRLIAFYLPQFHPIPENNEWWGYGFTEWMNVKPAKPQFLHHYQPHVPEELGYYDLRDSSVLQKQVELARLYGISGFCFYFYWFGGKTLLERPLQKYLYNRALDLPFCLCWANENWTRRWDGLDDDILIAQEHSEEDDLAFISHLTQYLKDRRYIRIGGNPLILVYRPSLLPNAKETAKRWRTWCRENEVGEIFLAYTQSFETVEPAVYGFDAAVEFPPNNSSPPDVTDSVSTLNDDFQGRVYDWRIFVERSKKYSKRDYPLFRGVNPGWDNTARKKEKGNIFVNSTPAGFQKWLYNAVCDTVINVSPDQRLVFVNAWNEWAEGAHLEPDQKYGYAYLEASRMAMTRARLNPTLPSSLSASIPKPSTEENGAAIVVHAFYLDILEEIKGYLLQLRTNFKLFITTPFAQVEAINATFVETAIRYEIFGVENRGRDVLPFLKIIPEVKKQGFKTVVKIHTKKSLHRDDGELWRRDIFDKYLLTDNFTKIHKSVNESADIGMVGPTGHIVPMRTYLGSNIERILSLASRMGIEEQEALGMPFVAGSMFFSRLDALEPLLTMALPESDFEDEEGQVDGTMAHALERAFSLSVFSAGFRLTDTAMAVGDGPPDSHVEITEEYQFAEKTV